MLLRTAYAAHTSSNRTLCCPRDAEARFGPLVTAPLRSSASFLEKRGHLDELGEEASILRGFFTKIDNLEQVLSVRNTILLELLPQRPRDRRIENQNVKKVQVDLRVSTGV